MNSPARMTSLEPPPTEMLSVFVAHLWFTSMSTLAHQASYTVLGIMLWAAHFAHYFFTFITLLASYLIGKTELKMLSLKDVWPVCFSQFVVTVTTCLVNDNGKNGALYAHRLTDVVVTVLVCFLARFFMPANLGVLSQNRMLVILLGLVCSIGWCEGIIAFNWSYLYLIPILDISTALHIMLVIQKYKKLNVHVNTFLLNVCGWTSLLLLPTAIWFRTDKLTTDSEDITSSWGVIDYVILLISYFGFTIMIYTKYWLICKCTQETYLVMRHFKYNVANWAQMFLQNFNVNIVTIISRPIGTILVLIYFRKRMIMHKNSQMKTVVQNGV